MTGTPERPRLCVYRSNGHIYAQVVDDRSGRTLVSASSLDADTRKELKGGSNVAAAKVIRENHEQLHHRRFMIHSKQRRDIEAHVVAGSPGDGRPDDKTVVRSAAALFVAEAAKLAFDSSFQLFDD